MTHLKKKLIKFLLEKKLFYVPILEFYINNYLSFATYGHEIANNVNIRLNRTKIKYGNTDTIQFVKLLSVNKKLFTNKY